MAATKKVSNNTKKAYAFALLTFAAGAWISAASGDWTWFSRSGSLVVVIGIILTSHEIFEHSRRLRRNRANVDAWYRSKHKPHTNRLSQFSRDWATESDMQAVIKARTQEEDIWEIEGHGLYILIGGTLAWGFGDLIGLLV